MKYVCWAITIIACPIAGFILLATLTSAKGAPQEAAGAAIASAMVIIPYVFTRAIEACSDNQIQKRLDRIVEILGKQDVS